MGFFSDDDVFRVDSNGRIQKRLSGTWQTITPPSNSAPIVDVQNRGGDLYAQDARGDVFKRLSGTWKKL